MHSTLLAFDIGTSGLKASLVDENLNVIRNVTTTYPTHRYPDGGCEQEAADWWMSAVRAMMMLRELAPESVKRVDAIGISGHMLGCLPMDRDGQTLRPAMIHADTRALSISNGLRAKFGRDYFYQICGNVLSPASTLCKTLWLKENEPELYARTVRILQSKDYLVYRLTGKMDTTDYSDASHGLLMNLQTKQYDAEMFRNVGVDMEKFPEIHASCEIAGRLSEEAAGCLGLRAGIPGLSENITVCSIVGNFLEHSRIFYFENDGEPQIFMGSADWMPRNLDRRVEILFPVEDEKLKARICHILEVQLADNVKAQYLRPDGTYAKRNRRGKEPVCAQDTFCAEAVQAAKEAGKKQDPAAMRVFIPLEQ